MKSLIKPLCGAAILFLFLPQLSLAQEQAATEEFKPMIIAITRAHWNMELEDFDREEWKEIETKWFENVTKKNEFIKAAEVLFHYYTPDNSEVLFATAYASWDDIDDANKRNNELAKEAWPDEAERKEFYKKQSSFYSNLHSDEIYSQVPNGFRKYESTEEPLIFYFRLSHTAWPEDGSVEEIRALSKEFCENVAHKSEKIIGYYPMRHFYGADSREFVEVFVAKDIADIHAFNSDEMGELIEAHWPDEEKRKEFFKSLNRYSDGWHGDLIYTNMPELSK